MNSSGTCQGSDGAVVAAIRSGDREQFRELVERYGDQVFAIAWSRLGSRDLAEEAAQETFIAAYKKLGLLKDAEKFSSWLASIARHIAINLGIRRRREIAKHQQFALESGDETERDETGVPTRENLRETLAELPAIHRECLVLFYLEGHNVAEAARLLGITESTFKTRLHRGRSAMRSLLESRLEDSLERLRPSKNFSGLVMAALPLHPPAAGFTGGMLASLKLIPGQWWFIAAQFLAILPGVLLGRWMAKKEKANFRDQGGFRARAYDRMLKRNLWVVASAMASFFLLVRLGGMREGLLVILALLLVPLGFASARRFHLCRDGQTALEVISLLLGFGLLAGWSIGWPGYMFLLGNSVVMVLASFSFRRLPVQMDYSLFLRGAEGLLEGTPTPVDGPPATYPELFAFARTLARRNLVLDWSRIPGGIRLYLTPVIPRLMPVWVLFRNTASRVDIREQIEARISPKDEAELRALSKSYEPETARRAVEDSVASAFRAFRDGDTALLGRVLGERSSPSIWRLPPSKTVTRKWMPRIMQGLALLMFLLGLQTRSDYWSGRPFSLEIVSLVEAQVRDGLDALIASGREVFPIEMMLSHGMVLPRREDFSPDSLRTLHEWLRERVKTFGATSDRPSARAALNHTHVRPAVTAGLISLEELGTSPEELREVILSWPPREREQYVALNPIRVGQFRHTVLNTGDLRARVELLEQVGALNLFDLSPAAAAILSRQILDPADPQWEDLDAKALNGLFLMLNSNPLRDTYDCLRVLAAASALDRIDRQACIDGILRFHLGRGLFRAERSAEPWFLRGDAKDTFAAYQSLRLLEALDRVPNAGKWEYRSPRFSRKNPPATPPWDVLEAWLLRREARE